jgi:putative FmdB family regulatory protein
MPNYEATCSTCTYAFDYYSSVKDREQVPECPHCSSKHTIREFRTTAPVRMDKDFSSENNGRGRYIDQLARVNPDGHSYQQNDPEAYCTSQSDALEKCRKRGLTAQKA